MLNLESIARILNHGFHGAPARPRPRDTWTCGLVKVNTVLLCDAGLAARLDGSEDAALLLVHRRYIKPLDVCGCSHRLIEWSERLDAGCRRCHGFHENWVCYLPHSRFWALEEFVESTCMSGRGAGKLTFEH